LQPKNKKIKKCDYALDGLIIKYQERIVFPIVISDQRIFYCPTLFEYLISQEWM